MSDSTPSFGEQIEGVKYLPRQGSYAIVFDAFQRVAAIRTASGCYLPGGGIDAEETAEEALSREIREECAAGVRIGRRVGEAIDYLHAASEGTYFAKRGVFYLAEFLSTTLSPDVVWIPIADIDSSFRQEGHIWAVREALR